jgi:tRNA threonylcarbamoyladenosine biosynthesis protein TsaB
MTILLAIETSTEIASVSLNIGARIISRDLSGVQTHSHGLLPAIQELLLDAELGLQQVGALAFGCGPGAFTGTRTACGVVQGLAYGLNLPVIPVVSLAMMAEAAYLHSGYQEMLCLLDARMDEVYWAHYRRQGEQWVELVAPRLGAQNDAVALARLRQLPVVLGDGLQLLASDSDIVMTRERPHAEFAVRIALRAFDLGMTVDAAQAQPLYLRNKIAQTTAERLSLRESR